MTGMNQGDISKFINGKKKGLSAGLLESVLAGLNGRIVFGDECAPTICDMGDYAMVPKVRAKLGAGSSLITEGETDGLYAFRKDFLKRIGLEKYKQNEQAVGFAAGERRA